MSTITLLIVGLVAGWIAGLVMRGEGYGVITDIIIGVIGAFLGSWLLRVLGFGIGWGIFGSIIVAAIGAIILVFLVRQISNLA